MDKEALANIRLQLAIKICEHQPSALPKVFDLKAITYSDEELIALQTLRALAKLETRVRSTLKFYGRREKA